MKSTYLSNIINEYQSKKDAALKHEKESCSSEIRNYENQIVALAKFSDFLIGAICVGALIGAIFQIFIGWIGIILGVLFGICLDFFLVNGYNALKCDKNKKFRELIEKRKTESKHTCEALIVEYDERIKNEEENYNKKVNDAIKAYSGSTVMDPIVKWLTDSLQTKILSANKEKYTKHIEATIAYRVETTQIELLEVMPHSKEYRNISAYNFYKERFCDVPDFYNKIGLAKALSKRVEIEIKNRSFNGILPNETVSHYTVDIESDDTFIKIYYKALNPNYKVAINMATGIEPSAISEESMSANEYISETNYIESEIEVVCPFCNGDILIRTDELDSNGQIRCPSCNEILEFEIEET